MNKRIASRVCGIVSIALAGAAYDNTEKTIDTFQNDVNHVVTQMEPIRESFLTANLSESPSAEDYLTTLREYEQDLFFFANVHTDSAQRTAAFYVVIAGIAAAGAFTIGKNQETYTGNIK